MVSSFPEKKQKRLFCFAEGYTTHISAKPTLGACPQQNTTVSGFFFSRKEAKAFALLRRRLDLGEADPGACPQQNPTLCGFFFSRKEAKALVLLRRRLHYPDLGEADPGGLGACPQQNTTLSGFFFSRKEANTGL
jgi:hypothetical protein